MGNEAREKQRKKEASRCEIDREKRLLIKQDDERAIESEKSQSQSQLNIFSISS